ncbi:MAG: hypothetical protein AAGG65_04980 [Pseudomonadota bacterium]
MITRISRSAKLAAAAACLTLLAACQSQSPSAGVSPQATSVNESYQSRDEVAAAGGVAFTMPMRVLETGTGWSMINDRLVTYYSVDGEKVYQRFDSGEVVERTWRVRPDQVVCETLVRSGEEICGADGDSALLLDEVLYVFDPAGDVVGAFDLVQGDLRQ